MIRDDALLNKKTDNLLHGCQSCEDKNHQINTCPFVNMIRRRQRPSESSVERLNFMRLNRKKTHSLLELYVFQARVKDFTLKQQKEEEIKELYQILANQRQQSNVDSESEETNSESEISQDQNDETSSILVQEKDGKFIQSSITNNMLQIDTKNQLSRLSSKAVKEIKEVMDTIHNNKVGKEQIDAKNLVQSEIMNTLNNNNSTKVKQLQVIEEGEEDTVQYTQVNRSIELQIKSNGEDTDKIIEDKPVQKNSKFIYDNASNSSGNPNLGEVTQSQAIDYQDINLPQKTQNQTDMLIGSDNLAHMTSLTPLSEKYRTNTLIEDTNNNNSYQHKTSLNITASLINPKQSNYNQNKNSYKSIQMAESTRKRNSKTSITDLNKYDDRYNDDESNVEDEANIITSERLQLIPKELTFNDEMFNVFQRNAKRSLRSERQISQKLNRELQSPTKLGAFSAQRLEELFSPLISPKRKPKQVATIILQKQESNEQSHTNSQGNIGSGSLLQSVSNVQYANQLNSSSFSPTIIHKRGSQKQLSNLYKNSQNIVNYFATGTPRSSTPYNVFSQQIDSQAETQTSTQAKEKKRHSMQSLNKQLQNFSYQAQQNMYVKTDPYRHQSQSPSPKNSDLRHNLMNQSSNETRIQTLQNLNGQGFSQNRLQTQFMISSGDSQQFSSEYQIKYLEGLQDLNMLIVRKNMRINFEKGLSRNNLIRAPDNEVDIDIMKNYHFYFPDKNAKVIVYKLRQQQDAAQAKRNKAQTKINIIKQTRKSKQSEQSNISLKNISISTKGNSLTTNQLSRPSIRV